ncbi:2-phospho-L-lactate guanylyltransferase [Cryobacterium sp. MP_M5]|uniref:2-phospho-L-lactate guanylyltransferase n=1 Tax=unclassified Cryobacterium TaxID=2649013 RepID=UPI0018CB79BF|nr:MULTISPECIES: 2-phospho-L-lactate guanylyltransferase [unclassified Cryobacterium]MBG6056634.1 2-phospho-L-lactate guanylyltransferase [Cryobacterium sp. MP_M3]MEC5176306.1 2-phospho-L-lactate guanylyltransferase [Cryobacterium sp. MP_M5]
METGQSAQWVAVVPVKGNPGAKSRLGDRPDRPRLADAFALDTVGAVLAARGVDRVLVVTADAGLAARLAALGAEIVPEDVPAKEAAAREGAGESARPPADPMNAAIRLGLTAASTRFPRANQLVLTGDLPALTPADIEHALALAAGHQRSMVSDAAGTGTTTLLALAGVPVDPRFGPGSRAAHEAAGHVPLEIPPATGIRSDVDTAADLLVAERLGLGAHTRLLRAGDPASIGR